MRFIFLLCLITLCLCQTTIDCGKEANSINCTFDSTTSTLTISGAGELSTSSPSPWRTLIGYKNPTKIVITASITEIPDGAFTPNTKFPRHFSNVQEVQLPSTLKKIGKKAFFNIVELVRVTIDGNITDLSIDDDAFNGCSSLTTLSFKVTNRIGDKAFAFTTALTTFDFSLVKEIGDSAFENTGIKNFAFGKDLIKMSNSMFKGCTVESITVDPQNIHYSVNDNILYETISTNPIKKRLIFYLPSKTETKFTVPNDVIEIAYQAFQNVAKLEHIDFGLSTETVVMEAFLNCANLTNVTIGKSIKTIQQDSFSGCNIQNYEVDECNEMFEIKEGILYTKSVGNEAIVKFLTTPSITNVYSIPSGIKVIYDNAFADITNLEELTIGNDVYSIHSYAFKGCTNLKKVTITASITSVGTSVFAGLEKLEEVIIGKNVKMIGNNMFNGCTKLSKVTFEEGSQLLTFEQYSFRNTAIGSIIIPDNVIYLMDNAFAEIKTLENVTIGKNVISIGTKCFTTCPKLKTFKINSEKLLTIDKDAFDNCPLIESIQIPASIEIISNYAFKRCTGLKTITYKGTDQPAFCSELAFDGLTNITVNVESTYSKQQFCGMYVTKANPPPVIPPGNNSTNSTNPPGTQPGTNSTNPPNGKPTNPDNGISLTTILMLLTFIFFMI